MTTKEFAKILQDKLTSEYGVDLSVASNQQIYRSLALICRQMMSENHKKFQSKAIGTGSKQVYYLCMEFLMGRSLKMSLFNLGLNDVAQQALAAADINIDGIFEEEPDAGLGNGGLGRLAACYLDGMATTGICGTGYSILYEYGIFKQKIVDGWQQERADNWLPGGQVWLKSHPDQAIEVRFDGEIHENWDHGFHYIQHTNYNSVMAVPSDMYVQGYDGKGVAKLRLWQAKAPDFDMSSFSLGNYNTAMSKNANAELISKVLYPNDNHVEGKILRLRQQYFLSAASIGDIVQNHLATYGTLENLGDKVAIQLNDTHPTLAIPEMMHQLIDVYGQSWNTAWEVTTKIFAYTNHTLLPEALEVWPARMMGRMLPRHLQIIYEINRRFIEFAKTKFGDRPDKLGKVSIVSGDGDNQIIRMANLSIVGSFKVNGVAKIHSELLKTRLVPEFYELWPEKFINVTNGITPRRWLYHANTPLATLISSKIGDDWITNLDLLQQIENFVDDPEFVADFMKIKKENKERLAKKIFKTTGVAVNTESIFIVQAKRIHEYKRQLMTILQVIGDYLAIIKDNAVPPCPKTYIFAGKAAPSYNFAKLIIKLINNVAEVVNNDPRVNDRIKVVFVPDYKVSLAELLIPAADISIQNSTAGFEASGTGNMKFALNGALTVGTYDGANIEIREAVGEDNFYLFGLREEQIAEMHANNSYKPHEVYDRSDYIKRIMNSLNSNMFCEKEYVLLFKMIYEELLSRDYYMVLADLAEFNQALHRAEHDYLNREEWAKAAIRNVARIGRFSSDRAVMEYADKIWHIKPVAE